MSSAFGRRPAARGDDSERPPRVISQVRGEDPGPTLICTGSLHGNEPGAFHALTRVSTALRERRPHLRGAFVALTGNRSALLEARRYLDRDLNRLWVPTLIADLKSGSPTVSDAVEHRELAELLDQIEAAVACSRGDIYVVDLHTTSADSPPFATIGDTLRNRAFAMRLGVPIVVGLEEHLEGTLLGYADTLGYVTMGFEGGRHDDPEAVERLAASVWMALAACGILIAPREVPEVGRAAELLRAASRGVPRVLEVRYRHPVAPGDAFQMDPGFAGFQPVAPGQRVARDRSGDVRSPARGRILMPLYQVQGDDGFFVMREFRPFWLAVSALLRHLRADAVVHWLPGVRRDPLRPGLLIVDRHTARWYALEIFHLLGYRRERLEGETLVVSRRRGR